jgi:hypothetical protein
MAFSVDFSVHELSLLRLEFLSGFLSSFFWFYEMLFMNRLEFSCFADFFVRMKKTEEGLVNSMEKRLEYFVKLMSKNSIRGGRDQGKGQS